MGRPPLTFCLHSEAAPYLPAEEKSPLFFIQREGIKDDGALYRLNRCVMGCPQAQQGVGCQAVPRLSWQWLSGCPQAQWDGGCQGVLKPVWDQWLPPRVASMSWAASPYCVLGSHQPLLQLCRSPHPSPPNRFSSLQPHPERLDVSFFVGGPVWAMEWCPTPEGSAAPQYVAVSCHRSMEETHSVSGLHSGPALLQLWGLGVLQTEQG